jgi:hypothetical protein
MNMCMYVCMCKTHRRPDADSKKEREEKYVNWQGTRHFIKSDCTVSEWRCGSMYIRVHIYIYTYVYTHYVVVIFLEPIDKALASLSNQSSMPLHGAMDLYPHEMVKPLHTNKPPMMDLPSDTVSANFQVKHSCAYVYVCMYM